MQNHIKLEAYPGDITNKKLQKLLAKSREEEQKKQEKINKALAKKQAAERKKQAADRKQQMDNLRETCKTLQAEFGKLIKDVTSVKDETNAKKNKKNDIKYRELVLAYDNAKASLKDIIPVAEIEEIVVKAISQKSEQEQLRKLFEQTGERLIKQNHLHKKLRKHNSSGNFEVGAIFTLTGLLAFIGIPMLTYATLKTSNLLIKKNVVKNNIENFNSAIIDQKHEVNKLENKTFIKNFIILALFRHAPNLRELQEKATAAVQPEAATVVQNDEQVAVTSPSVGRNSVFALTDPLKRKAAVQPEKTIQRSKSFP